MQTPDGQRDSIAVLVDGSHETLQAARFASVLAARSGSRLLLISPMAARPGRGFLGSGDSKDRSEASVALAREEGERRLEAIRKEVDPAIPIEFRAVQVGRTVAEAVLEVVEGERCLTLVLPRRGPGLLMRLLGDDTARIIKRSPVAVTLAPT